MGLVSHWENQVSSFWRLFFAYIVLPSFTSYYMTKLILLFTCLGTVVYSLHYGYMLLRQQGVLQNVEFSFYALNAGENLSTAE